MGVFQYEARNRAGEFFAGTVEARDEREAAGLIRRRGLWVAALHLQCEEAAGAPAVSRWRQQLAGRSRRRRLPSCACSSCGRWRR